MYREQPLAQMSQRFPQASVSLREGPNIRYFSGRKKKKTDWQFVIVSGRRWFMRLDMLKHCQSLPTVYDNFVTFATLILQTPDTNYDHQ